MMTVIQIVEALTNGVIGFWNAAAGLHACPAQCITEIVTPGYL
jgi:hypothetical protein